MRYYTLFLSFFILSRIFSQQIDHSNTRHGEDVEYCTTHKKLQELLRDPEYRKQFEEEQAQFRNEEITYRKSARKRGTVYTIPVVFHVLHSGGIENISDEQIFDALAVLNRDFRLQNEDANTVHADFRNLPSDVEIEFKMATIAPNGACFRGITRTYSTDETTDGSKQVSLIRNGNDVFKGEWSGNKYLHFFICKSVGGAAGYTYRPWGSGNFMTNGIWILHNYVGSIGTSNTIKSRAITHEVGHWLNLMHTWGGNNNPGIQTSCNDINQDEVDDTPKTIGVTSCNLNENSCGTRANVENYMDYSYCNKMFTTGQVSRMRTALMSNIGGRSYVSSFKNLTDVGVISPKLCVADFISNKTTICMGDDVLFTDKSFNESTTWNWSFEGGTPSTSTQKNPTVLYEKSGYFNVSLKVSNGTDTLTVSRDSFIYVLPIARRIPYLESYDFKYLKNNKFWSVNNPQNNNQFEIYSGKGYNDSSCVYLRNFADNGKNIDELISGTFDLSQVKNSKEITFQFRFANARKTTSSIEILRFSISNDCGITWSSLDVLTSSSISSIVSDQEWFPSDKSDWKTFTATDIPSEFWTKECRVKIEFQGNGGNNFFIDDLNIYPGSPSEEIVAEHKEIQTLNQNSFTVIPNPVVDKLSIQLNNDDIKLFNLKIFDLTGKIIKFKELNAISDIEVQVEEIKEGSYLLQLETNQGSYFKQIVVR
jgi:PKD repeat protein